MTVIGLIKIDAADRNEDLVRIFDTDDGHDGDHGRDRAPRSRGAGMVTESVIANIEQLREDLRAELRVFRARVPYRVMQSRPLDG